jgi:glycosyltransferase involved in cell wall biosynthesis
VVVGDPDDVDEVVAAFERLLDDDTGRRAMGVAARARAEAEFSYEVLSARLWNTLRALP